MSYAIRVESLGKRYHLGMTHSGSIRELVNRTVGRLFGRKDAPLPHELAEWSGGRNDMDPDGSFWALRDVSFEVKPGEVIGIIGRNGAGKSTLLKILSHITLPTRGRIELHGRVASLLEVGTGFHQELSGRENVFLNGAILGMTKAEIHRKFDEIVAFAEIDKFIDTPVKRYSSGMYIRLAFAVAAHLEPEILVVDEVLAVGDGAFQQKCLGKMSEVARHGRTIFFVSHNLVAVRNLCSRALLLEGGRVAEDNEANQVADRYIRANGASSESPDRQWPDPINAPGNDKIRLARVRILPECMGDDGVLSLDRELEFELEYWNLFDGTKIIVNLEVYTIDGVEVFESFTSKQHYWHARSCPRGRFRCRCRVPANLLNNGTYRLRVVFLDDAARTLLNYPEALFFTVHDPAERDIPFFGRWQGVVRPQLEWKLEFVADDLDMPTVSPGVATPGLDRQAQGLQPLGNVSKPLPPSTRTVDYSE